MDARTRSELQQLLGRLAEGERAAFDRAFALLWPLTAAFCSRALPGPDGEDAAQSALLRVFTRAAEFDPARPALPWVLGIAAFECRTLRKRALRRREEPHPGGDGRARAGAGLPAAGPDPELAAIERDLLASAGALLGELRGPDAATLLALARGERPAVPGATFRKRLERALARFRSAWRARHGLD